MTLEEGLTAYLKAQGVAGGRVYPMLLPQSPTFPCLTYQRISGERVRGIEGPMGRARPRIQVDVWASSYSSAKATATALRTAMDGYSGLMGTVQVDAVSMDSERDLYDPQREVQRVSMDFLMSHTE